MIEMICSLLIKLESFTIFISFYYFYIELHFLDFLNSLLICQIIKKKQFQENQNNYYKSLLSCFLLQYGGLLLTSLIIGQSSPILITYISPFSLFIAWLIIFYILEKKIPFILYLLAHICSIFSYSFAITFWGMDLIIFYNTHLVNNLKESFILCLVCSILSYCGSDMISDLFQLTNDDPKKLYTLNKLPIHFSFTKQGQTLRSNIIRAIILASIYYYYAVIQNQREYGNLYVCIIQSFIYLRGIILTDTDFISILFKYLPNQTNDQIKKQPKNKKKI